jgi:hypothetical protein
MSTLLLLFSTWVVTSLIVGLLWGSILHGKGD